MMAKANTHNDQNGYAGIDINAAMDVRLAAMIPTHRPKPPPANSENPANSSSTPSSNVIQPHVCKPLAACVAVVFGVALGGAAAIGVALGWTEPYWVPEPILILVLYILIGKRDRIRGKAIGTSLGVAAAIPVALIDPPAWVLATLATVAFVLALTQYQKYWLYYGLYTFSFVLALAAPGQVGSEAEERGVQILVGIGLLVIGIFILHALATWLSKRAPQPELTAA